MAISQATDSLKFTGWVPQKSEPRRSSIVEKVSSVFAYALLWIKSLFDQETVTLLEAFEADRTSSYYEQILLVPVHSTLLEMRRSLISLADRSSLADIEKYIKCIDWNSFDEIKRIDAANATHLFLKSQNIDTLLTQNIHNQMINLREALRAHCTHFSHALMGLNQDRSYQQSKQALRTSLSALREHFSSIPN